MDTVHYLVDNLCIKLYYYFLLPVDPYNWYFPSGEQIERKDLMVVLTNLDGIYIKASYGIEVDGQARLSNVKLDSATEVPLCAEDDDYCDDTINNPVTRYAQQAEAVFNKISGPRNKNHPVLISMLQGFQKCIA